MEYPASLGKEEIVKQWEQACEMSRYESGHSYSGEIGMLSGKPKFCNTQLDSANSAHDYIVKNHEKWTPPLAVSYFDERKGESFWMIGGWCSS